MKYVICLKKKNIGKAWPLSIQEAMNNSLRIVPTLLSKHFISPWEGSNVLGYLKSFRGATFRGLICAWALDLPWQPTVYRVPCGAQNLNEVVQAPPEGTLAPSVWQTQDPSSLQCWGDGHLKTWILCCHSCPSPAERGNPVEEDAFNHIIFPGPATHVYVSNGKSPAEARA